LNRLGCRGMFVGSTDLLYIQHTNKQCNNAGWALRQPLCLNRCMIFRMICMLWDASACICRVFVSPTSSNSFWHVAHGVLFGRGGIEMSMTWIDIQKCGINLSIMYWLVLICCVFVGFSHICQSHAVSLHCLTWCMSYLTQWY